MPSRWPRSGVKPRDMLFRRIVCGVDGSPAGFEALRQVVTLRTADTRVVSVTVSETHLTAQEGAAAGRLGSKLKEEASRTRDTAVGYLEGIPLSDARVVEGQPPQSLLAVLDAESATLLAVGTHGGGHIARMLLGSVATAMLQQATCSVLVARPSGGSRWFPRSIVVGMDGSPQALTSAAVANEIADRVGATVRTIVARGGPRVDRGVLRELDGLEWVSRHPVNALVDASKDADLVIVGSRGLRAFEALGSVSERVAHQGHCSILVVRP